MTEATPGGTGTGVRSSAMTTAAYVALALTWGSSFLLMKVALEGFTPAQVALGRIFIGTATLAALMLATRRRWPRQVRLWAHMVVVALFLCVIPFLLFAWAGTSLPSGLSAILNATTPIWTAIAVAVLVRGIRLTAGQIAGVVLGAAGVLVIMGGWRLVTDPVFLTSLPAQAACLGATASYGIAFAWMERYVNRRHGHDSITIASVQLVGASAIGLVLAPFIAFVPVELQWTPATCLAALGMLGTGFAYVWNTRVLVSWGSLAASTVTYVTPIVGVALGILILGEDLTWHEPVGAIVVILSVMLVQKRRIPVTWPRRAPSPTSASTPP